MPLNKSARSHGSAAIPSVRNASHPYMPGHWRRFSECHSDALIYRGVSRGNPFHYPNAMKGKVVPWGLDFGRTDLGAAEDYIYGIIPNPSVPMRSAGFTAWTPLIQVARRFSGDGGIILAIPLALVLDNILVRPLVNRFDSDCELFVSGRMDGLQRLKPYECLGETVYADIFQDWSRLSWHSYERSARCVASERSRARR